MKYKLHHLKSLAPKGLIGLVLLFPGVFKVVQSQCTLVFAQLTCSTEPKVLHKRLWLYVCKGQAKWQTTSQRVCSRANFWRLNISGPHLMHTISGPSFSCLRAPPSHHFFSILFFFFLTYRGTHAWEPSQRIRVPYRGYVHMLPQCSWSRLYCYHHARHRYCFC